MFMIMIVTANL